MDFRRFDRARRSSTEIEVDHIEAYATGLISRREFVTRGTVLGLSMPFLGAIIAACGSEAPQSAATTKAGASGAAGGATKPGGILKVANQKPSGPVDPVAMDNLGAYTVVTIPFEYLCGPGEGAALGADARRVLEADADGKRLDVQRSARVSSGTTARRSLRPTS